MDHPNLMAPSKNNGVPSQSVIKYRKQVVWMLGTVVLAFFVCLLPFRAFTLWIISVPGDTIMEIGMETYWGLVCFCRIMFHIHSAINPILYNIMSSKFRGGFLKLCGVRHLHKRYKHRTEINRKNTFNTTSSTNTSSNQTSESFWYRYRTSSRCSSSLKEVKEASENGEGTKNKGSLRESYIRIPLRPVDSFSNKKPLNGDSFV